VCGGWDYINCCVDSLVVYGHVAFAMSDGCVDRMLLAFLHFSNTVCPKGPIVMIIVDGDYYNNTTIE
jgi:hypothetical protein